MSKPVPPPVQILEWHERLYHRDKLRSARYTALADAEGFHEVCFAIEALGMRLLGKKADLGQYRGRFRKRKIKHVKDCRRR